MNEKRPYLEIPLPSNEDFVRFEEWQKKKQKEEEEKQKDQTHVIIIDIQEFVK